MTTVFVDLVNLDGSRPEGSLRFSLERLVLGDPDVVPSAVEVKIRDGKARVENLLPGAMRVRVNAGCWSKDWEVSIPESGEHDLFKLLGEQAKEFEHALWATLLGRVEALENTPAVDLAPVEQRLDALENAPVVDLAPLEKRVTELEAKPEPEPVDLMLLEDATRNLSGRIEKAEKRIEQVSGSLGSTQFSLFQRELPKLKNQLAELQAHFAPVELVLNGDIEEALTPIYETGTTIGLVQHAGRVSISFRGFDIPGLLQALGELKTSHFPKAAMFADGEDSNCSVELYQGAKFLTKIEPKKILLYNRSGELTFQMALNEVLAVVQETGATNIYLSTFYYTNDLPPEITE